MSNKNIAMQDQLSHPSAQSQLLGLPATRTPSTPTLPNTGGDEQVVQLFSRANPFFGVGRGAKWLPHGGVTLLVSLVLLVLSALPSQFVGPWLRPLYDAAAGSTSPLLTASVQTLQHLINYLPLFALLALWLRWAEGRALWTTGFPALSSIGHMAWQVSRGLFVGVSLYVIPVGLTAWLGLVTLEQGPSSLQGIGALGGVLMALAGWLVQGAAEEILTRGWLMQVIGLRHRPWIAVLVASLFFALLHGLNPDFNGWAALNLTLFGLLAALYVLREGNLWGVVGLHAAANWTQGNLLNVPISGREGAGGSLLNLGLTGPAWLSGGGFGPEGSLLMSLVLLLGILLLLVWPQRHSLMK